MDNGSDELPQFPEQIMLEMDSRQRMLKAKLAENFEQNEKFAEHVRSCCYILKEDGRMMRDQQSVKKEYMDELGSTMLRMKQTLENHCGVLYSELEKAKAANTVHANKVEILTDAIVAAYDVMKTKGLNPKEYNLLEVLEFSPRKNRSQTQIGTNVEKNDAPAAPFQFGKRDKASVRLQAFATPSPSPDAKRPFQLGEDKDGINMIKMESLESPGIPEMPLSAGKTFILFPTPVSGGGASSSSSATGVGMNNDSSVNLNSSMSSSANVGPAVLAVVHEEDEPEPASVAAPKEESVVMKDEDSSLNEDSY
eukprot:g4764.t1